MQSVKSNENLLEMASRQLADVQSGRLHAPASVAVGAMYCALLSVLDEPSRSRLVDHPSVRAAQLGAQRLALRPELREATLRLIQNYYAPEVADAGSALTLAQEVLDAACAHRQMSADPSKRATGGANSAV